MDKKAKMRFVLEKLEERYPDAVCSLEFRDPLELMVSTQLSAQCTDKRVNMVTKELFRKYRTLDDYADAKLSELEEDIRATGFFRNKAKNIKNMAIKLREEYYGRFPDNLEELMKLAGVGRKTGNLFLSEVNGIPGIVVDTHVKRISNRLGFTKHQDPDKIEKDLNKITDKDAWIKLGHLIISFGRDICNARNPKCELCFFKGICVYYDEK
jgi:endonuclease III